MLRMQDATDTPVYWLYAVAESRACGLAGSSSDFDSLALTISSSHYVFCCWRGFRCCGWKMLRLQSRPANRVLGSPFLGHA